MERDDLIRVRWPKKGPCLVPHKSAVTKDSMLLSCHENDFCLCDVREAFDMGIAERDKYARAMAHALENGIFPNKAQVKREIEEILK